MSVALETQPIVIKAVARMTTRISGIMAAVSPMPWACGKTATAWATPVENLTTRLRPARMTPDQIQAREDSFGKAGITDCMDFAVLWKPEESTKGTMHMICACANSGARITWAPAGRRLTRRESTSFGWPAGVSDGEPGVVSRRKRSTLGGSCSLL